MFSARSHFKQPPNPLWNLLESRRKRGKRVIDLTESNPTRCQLTYPSSWIKSLSKKSNLCYEPDPRGTLLARNEIIKYYRRNGAKLNPRQVFLTSGTSEAYHFLFSLLFNPGDQLLIPAPGYPLMESLAKLNDIRLSTFGLEFNGVRWKIDFSSLQAHLSGRTRAITVVHPNNPTGSYVDPKDQAQLIAFARRRNLAIIADEVFFDYRYSSQRPFPRSFSTQNTALTFTLNGLSKMVCLPQMKISWIIVTGPKNKMNEAVRRLETIADTYLSVNTPTQNSLALFFKDRLKIQSQVMNRILKNRLYAVKNFKERLPEGEILNSEGGWYVAVRLPRIMTDDAWAITLLKKEGVLAYPGYFFDFPFESCLILSLLPPEPLFKEGIEKIIKTVSYSLSIIG